MLAALLLCAGSALAGTVTNQRPLLFSFNGEDTTAGRFVSVREIAIEEAGGDVYVLSTAGKHQGTGSEQEPSKRVVDKFDAEGNAQDFAGNGASSLSGSETPCLAFGGCQDTLTEKRSGFFEVESFSTDVAVDNSCTLHEPPLAGSACEAFDPAAGDLYVEEEAGPLHIFNPEGRYQCTLPRSTVEPWGFAIDGEGHPWLIDSANRDAHEFANTGCTPAPPIQIGEFPLPAGDGIPTRIGVNRSGSDLYVADCSGCPSPVVEKYVAGSPDSVLTTMPTRDLTVDQASADGHVFAIGESKFREFEPCASSGCAGSEVPGSPFGGDLIGDGRGIAYSPARDWVYVSDLAPDDVKVFGPPASGIVPDVSTGETDGIGETEATAHGTINPQGVSNSYHFEWTKGEAQSISVEATGGSFKLSTGGFSPVFSAKMPFDVSVATLRTELVALFGNGNVSVTGTPAAAGVPGEYSVVFEGGLAGQNVAQMEGNSSELSGGSHSVVVRTVTQGQSWGAAQPQPSWPEANPSIEPTDSADHTVSKSLTGLRPNTTYDVRLVGTNTEPEGDPEKRLNAYAVPDTFTTEPPPSPSVAGLAVSGVSAESAHVAATVDPKGDETLWRILLSTAAKPGAGQGECEALSQLEFTVAGEGTIPSGEAGTVPIARDLSSLEPSQTYCVRVTAANGNPKPGAADAVFTTEAVKPAEVALAYAAPRTDASARLNAYVNPEGEAPLGYRFEYSPDGTTWIPLPERISTVEARRQIVVGEELTGLSPATTYSYRLGLVGNEKGQATIPAGTKSFTTRTPAEMTIPPNALGEVEKRGFELVNNPEKGNQNARAAELYSGLTPLRADGEAFLWTVTGGAPGANSGSQATFLARRAPTGWSSQSLLPPASEQLGGGGLTYFPVAASPDFSSFIFQPALPGILTSGAPSYVRLDAEGNQQFLGAYEGEVKARVDVSRDSAHVVLVNPDTGKLEDIGSGSPEEIGLIPRASAPPGVPQPGGSTPECGLEPRGGSFFGSGEGAAASQYEAGYDRMSTTGASRVYFEVHPNGSGCTSTAPWALYERDREGEPTTIPIVTPGQATADTAIIRATPDGRSAYFVTSASLAAADKNTHPDVYRWDETTHASTCLTCVVPDANVTGRVFVSDDFSHVYFSSTNQLLPRLGSPGETNLYVLHSGTLGFVASPVTLDNAMRLSANGNVLAFLSDEQLTADAVASQCPDLISGTGGTAPCKELYLYDDREGSVECVSCRHGATTTSSVTLSGFGESFQVSANGSTLAFTTAESLLALDVNGSADIYEWRNGAIRLITDGISRYPSGLAGPTPQAIDASGSNVVFSVASPGLTGYESDEVANMYDARIGGGFPRPSPPEHCSEESCQGPLQAAPPLPQPASAGYVGPGNVPPRRCRHGKGHRSARCAKGRHHHHHHRHRQPRHAGHGSAK
jgi:hypothetical protein